LKNVINIMMALIIVSLIFSCSSSSKNKKTEQELYTDAQNFSEKGDFQSAIKTYEEILKLYPDSPRTYKAQFLIAFVYSENLKDHQKAKENYIKLIDKYPTCDLVDDAQYMLKTMESDSLPIIRDTSSSSSD
jgi:outer membrane protein assembly factor BamD (BamD/ComL family)